MKVTIYLKSGASFTVSAEHIKTTKNARGEFVGMELMKTDDGPQLHTIVLTEVAAIVTKSE